MNRRAARGRSRADAHSPRVSAAGWRGSGWVRGMAAFCMNPARQNHDI